MSLTTILSFMIVMSVRSYILSYFSKDKFRKMECSLNGQLWFGLSLVILATMRLAWGAPS